MKPVLAAITVLMLGAACSSAPKESMLIYEAGVYSADAISEGMILVEGGSFQMGVDSLMPDEGPVHPVIVSSFYIGSTEVTQSQWMAVFGNNPSQDQNKDFPVENVTWYDAINFANKLSVLEGLEPAYSFRDDQVVWDKTRNGYRLPTEAEWEFAARGGNRSQGYRYSGGDAVDEVAHHIGNNVTDKNKPVGRKKPNELGLYDMTGNVYEWTWDWKSTYTREPKTDPSGDLVGRKKSVRGGSAFCYSPSLYLGWRNSYTPDTRARFLGFRLARNDGP